MRKPFTLDVHKLYGIGDNDVHKLYGTDNNDIVVVLRFNVQNF